MRHATADRGGSVGRAWMVMLGLKGGDNDSGYICHFLMFIWPPSSLGSEPQPARAL